MMYVILEICRSGIWSGRTGFIRKTQNSLQVDIPQRYRARIYLTDPCLLGTIKYSDNLVVFDPLTLAEILTRRQ